MLQVTDCINGCCKWIYLKKKEVLKNVKGLGSGSYIVKVFTLVNLKCYVVKDILLLIQLNVESYPCNCDNKFYINFKCY